VDRPPGDPVVWFALSCIDGEIDLVDGWSRRDVIRFRSNRMVNDD